MNKKQIMKQVYLKPQLEVLKIQVEFSLLAGSKFEGGHNPGEIGHPIGDAKKGDFFEDEDNLGI